MTEPSAAVDLLITGGGINGTAIAREAALKLKETCNRHAEAFSGAEFLHGPVSLVETRPYAERAATLVDELPDAELAKRLDAIVDLAGAELYLHRFEDASRHAQRAVAVGRATGQHQLFPVAFAILGITWRMLGNLRDTRDALEGNVESARLSGNAQTMAWALYGLAQVAIAAGDIERMVGEVPGATLVAIYSGKGERGELRVVARDAYRVATSDLVAYGSGNVVDLPALQWLAKQPGPRVWLSDGNVTGVEDVATRAITKRCREICTLGQIVRVSSAAAAAEALGRPFLAGAKPSAA